LTCSPRSGAIPTGSARWALDAETSWAADESTVFH
jgi:hypothetical protein